MDQARINLVPHCSLCGLYKLQINGLINSSPPADRLGEMHFKSTLVLFLGKDDDEGRRQQRQDMMSKHN